MRLASALFLAIAVAAGCAGIPPVPSATTEPASSPAASPSSTLEEARIAGWRADLEQLVTARERYHPEPWHGIERAEYVAAVGEVSDRVPELTDDELLVEITRLAAMPTWAGRDGHGGIHPWGEGTYGVHSYPLRLYRFSDGLFVTDALPPYDSLIGSEVTAVNGHPVADALAAVEPLVPRDNPQQILSHGPLLLLAAEVLHGLGIIEDAEAPTPFTLRRGDAESEVELDPIPIDDYQDWAGGHHVMSPPARPDGPAWIRQPTTPVWWELQPDSATAYVQYNFTGSPDDVPEEVAAAIADGSVERLVVDVRHNPGGNNGAYDRLLRLVASADVERTYVIMGRATFSAAGNFVTEVEQTTEAILVGEDSGTSPNQYGDAVTTPLEHSGLILRVAPEFVVRSDPADVRITIEPDIVAELSSGDYFGDRDPAMEAILADS